MVRNAFGSSDSFGLLEVAVPQKFIEDPARVPTEPQQE